MEDGNGDGIDFITEDLALTSARGAADREALARHRIRAIVDASNMVTPRFPGIRYHVVPITDPDERLCEFLPATMAFIDEERRRGPVLVHCAAGISRSPTLVVCYLHQGMGMPLPAALQLVSARRRQASPHPVFLKLVDQYYRRAGDDAGVGGQLGLWPRG
jgi:protein-tyrosine phosphatase